MAKPEYETLVEESIKVDDKKEIRLKVDKNLKSEKLTLHIREFSTTESYTGYTPKGVTIPLESTIVLDRLEDVISPFLNAVRKVFSE